VWMRYHQCPQTGRIGRIFSRPVSDRACWLDELPEDEMGPEPLELALAGR
jgi:lysine 2,3-aminomutase